MMSINGIVSYSVLMTIVLQAGCASADVQPAGKLGSEGPDAAAPFVAQDGWGAVKLRLQGRLASGAWTPNGRFFQMNPCRRRNSQPAKPISETPTWFRRTSPERTPSNWIGI